MRKVQHSLTLLVLIASSGSAFASLTFTDLPGNYTITGANYDNGGVTIVGTNNSNSTAFSLIGGNFTTLTADASWVVGPNPIGVANGYVLANALLSDFTTTDGVVYSGSAILSSTGLLNFTAVGPSGLFGGTNPANGNALTGNISGSGVITNVATIPRIGSELVGITDGVYGSFAAGSYGFGGLYTHAFCTSGGARLALDVGVSSVAFGVDGASGNCFGQRDGIAGRWDADGTFVPIPGVGGGTINGEVTSGFGGLYIVKDGAGNLYVSDGVTTKSFAAYLISLSLTPPGTAPPDAWFIGDPGSGARALVFQGSIEFATGTQADFLQPFQAEGVPEPASFGLAALVLLGMMLLYRKR